VGDTVPGKTSAYKLTLMKKLSQSTKPSKIKERVADLDLVQGLYRQLGPALQALALKPGGMQYYAHSVIRSEIFQLTRRNDPDRYLYLIAFITHQYYRLQDNLVDVLLASLRSFQNGAIREHKEQCYAQREQRNESLKALLGDLERGLVGTLTTIGSITEDRALSDAEKVTRIRALLAQRERRRGRSIGADQLPGSRGAGSPNSGRQVPRLALQGLSFPPRSERDQVRRPKSGAFLQIPAFG